MTDDRPRLDLDKLGKICALFRSDFPEERATAAAIADRMVRASGHTWEILFQALKTSAGRIAELEQHAKAPPERDWSPVWNDPQTDQEAIEACLDWADAMTSREQAFLVSISGRRMLSEKQRKWLYDLVRKAKAAAKVGGAQHGH